MSNTYTLYKPAVIDSCLCAPSTKQERHIPADRYYEYVYLKKRIRGLHQLPYEDRETIIIMIGQVYETLPICCTVQVAIAPHYKDFLIPEQTLDRNGVIFSARCYKHQNKNDSLAARLNSGKKFYSLNALLDFLA